MRACVDAYIYVYMYIYISLCIYISICLRTNICISTYIYIYIYIYVYIYIYIYIYIYMFKRMRATAATTGAVAAAAAAANQFAHGCVARLALHEKGGVLGRAHEPMICPARHVLEAEVLQLPLVEDHRVRGDHFDVRGEAERSSEERDPSEAAACLGELRHVVLLWASGRSPRVRTCVPAHVPAPEPEQLRVHVHRLARACVNARVRERACAIACGACVNGR
jgi:hypothetical protein